MNEDSTRDSTDADGKGQAPAARALDYGRPGQRRLPPHSPSAVFSRIVAGCVGYILLTLAYFYTFGNTFLPLERLVVWAYLTLMLLGLTIWLRVMYGYRGYGYGILTALLLGFLLLVGVVILIIATCKPI